MATAIADKTITVNGHAITVSCVKVNEFPPAYQATAVSVEFPDETPVSHVVTIGAGDGAVNIPSLTDLQAALDDARAAAAAQMALHLTVIALESQLK